MNKIKLLNNEKVEEFLEVDKKGLKFVLENYYNFVMIENDNIYIIGDNFESVKLDFIECED